MTRSGKRIFLLGYYGFGNWGDELSLLAVLHDFENISLTHSVPFHYSILIKNEESVSNLPLKGEMICRRHFLTILSGIAQAHYLVVGGGSLLQDSTSLRSLLYYIFLLGWALVCHRPIIFYRCGLGPFRWKIGKSLTSFVLRRIKLFIARDQESADLAKEMGVNANRLRIGIDPVISPFLQFLSPSESLVNRVAFFVRNCDVSEEKKLIDGIKYFRENTQEKIEIVAFHRQYDQEIAVRIASQVDCPWKYFQSIQEIQSYFNQLKAIFTMRLHPAILSALRNIPWFALNIDPKIESFASWWGKENLITWDDFSSKTLMDKYRRKGEIFLNNKGVKDHFAHLDERCREWVQTVLVHDNPCI